MLTRRALLSRVTVTLSALLATPLIVSCGEETTGNPGDLTFTSTSSSGHTHSFTLTAADLASPATISGRLTGGGNGHTHAVTLSATEMSQIAAGSTVTKSTTADGTGHDHSYTLKKA